jgi:5'-3' exonuclease
MGIPSYFSFIIKNYPSIIKKYVNEALIVDNFYLDANSIIYDIYSKIDTEIITESISTKIITNVISKIEEYIHNIKPSKTVFVAFDGVAPKAKCDQQRSRRYKSWYQNQISRQLFNKEKEDPWNTVAITPGTNFMYQLNTMITNHFNEQTCKRLHVSNVIVSGSNKFGEGEHKIFEYIRTQTDKHKNQTSVIYGLDADLIMLSMNHLPVTPKLYLFRETPHFIQSIDSSLEPNANYLLDMPEFAYILAKYMNNDKEMTIQQQKNKIYDYIFLCFFLGNDFLPHFPSINIRTGGVDKMINAYKATIGESDLNLTDGKTIFWINVRKVVQLLANQEEEFIIKEHTSRNKKERYKLPDTTPEEKLKQFESLPIYNRDIEKFINPLKPNWQQRYYNALFNIKSDLDNSKRKDISINYLEGLEWNMKYYTSGCPDWRWSYKYNYPPLLQDLIRVIPLFDTIFVPEKPPNPVSEIVQLCYVLPRSSLDLLPTKLYIELLKKYDHFYNGKCGFIWAYCRYFWEAHVEMHDIDINELETFINDNKYLL